MNLSFGQEDTFLSTRHEEEAGMDGMMDYHSSAARAALPDGYFLHGPLPNSMAVANNMGTSIHDMHYLFFALGEDKFNVLLKRIGLLTRHDVSPMSLSWTCQGVPATPNIPAQPCSKTSESHLVTMVGAREGPENHPLYGDWCCQACHGKIERRERDLLQTFKSSGGITQGQQERLEILNSRTRTNQRNGHIEAQGFKQVRSKEIGRERMKSNQEPRCKRKAEYNRERDAKRTDTKKSGEKKTLSIRQPYPVEFMNKID